ncbi:Alpha/Beta hydrolase protein [Penicillium capsulatum]|uniref:Alpha/Beta hydrolase protein n=1 Tax=Penicillium capsulatum TaxID=69766 RepID=A0A9W9IAR4_9EURO|nr:Alpha/Beta hydrolase protein [Penicillium capsulatum]KAJ6136097.1 Alpha/Beta hydrolase protein [Penicillium capsulatum]
MKIIKYTRPLLAALVYARPTASATKTNNNPTLPLSTDSTFNFQYMIALGDAITGGSDIGPVLGAAKNIKDGDMASFSEQFYKLANQTKAHAQDPANAYDPVNVRETWFSAAQYFRRADMFLHNNWSNPLINRLWTEQTQAFNKALAALPIPGKRIRIPAKEGNFIVEAIWYGASESGDRKLPTLVIGNGLDAAQEDSYHYFVAGALARGWNCITYDGPGQPTVRREQNIGFIPKWETVVNPVVDYVLSEKSQVVDEDRLVLVGNSFGGYLAARAAAFEPRLSAVVLVDGVWDTYAGYASQLSPELIAVYEAGNYTEFDHKLLSLREAGKLATSAAWGLDYGLWSFNTHSPSEFFTQSKLFRLEDVVDKIKMPVFVGDAEFENIFQGQPKQVKDALGDKATLHLFPGVAGYHCQTGAGQDLTRTIFAWLHKTLGKANDEWCYSSLC